MKHNWLYFQYVYRHKRFVYQEGRKLGVPLWRLIIHDWDKFTPLMWRSYSNYFYNFDQLMTEERAEHLKYIMPTYPWQEIYTQEKCKAEFNQGWNRHQKWNDHHWQYYVRMDDDGTTEVMEMPEVAALEMVADWKGAGRSIPNAKPLLEWYDDTMDARRLHPKTQAFVEKLIGYKRKRKNDEPDHAISTESL